MCVWLFFFSSQIYKILYYYKRCVICFIVCFWYTLGPPWEWNMYSIWKHVLSNWQCLRTYSWQLTQSRHKDWIAWARLKCVCWGMLACPKHTDIKNTDILVGSPHLVCSNPSHIAGPSLLTLLTTGFLVHFDGWATTYHWRPTTTCRARNPAAGGKRRCRVVSRTVSGRWRFRGPQFS